MSYMIRRSSLAHSPPPPSAKQRRVGITSSYSSSSSSSASNSKSSTSTSAEEDDEAWTSKTDNLVLKQTWTGGKRKRTKGRGGVRAGRIPSSMARSGSRSGSGSGSRWKVESKSRSKENQDNAERTGTSRGVKIKERVREAKKQKAEREGKSPPPRLETISDPISGSGSDSGSNAKVGRWGGDEGQDNDEDDEHLRTQRGRQRRPLTVEGSIVSPRLEGGIEGMCQEEDDEDEDDIEDVNEVEIHNLVSPPLSALTSIAHTNTAIDKLGSKSDIDEDEARKGGRRASKRSAGIPSRFRYSPDPTPPQTSASASRSVPGAVSAMNTASSSNANSNSESKAKVRSKSKSKSTLKRNIKSGEQDGDGSGKKKVRIDETLNRTRIILDLPHPDQAGLIGPPSVPSISSTPGEPKIPRFRTYATSSRSPISASDSDPTSTSTSRLTKDPASGLPNEIRALRYSPSDLTGTNKGQATVIGTYPELELSSDSDTDTLHDNDPHHDHEDDPGHDQRIEVISTKTSPETGSEMVHPNSIVDHTLDNGPRQSLSKLGAHTNERGSIETLIQAVEASELSKFNQTKISSTPTSSFVIREPERESEKGEGEGDKGRWYSSRIDSGPEENHKFMEEWRKPDFRFEKEKPHCTLGSAESLKLVSPGRWLDFVNVCTQQSRTQSSSRITISNLISSTSTPGPIGPLSSIQPLSAPSLHGHTNTPMKIEIEIPRWGAPLIPARIDRHEGMEVTTYLPPPTQLRNDTQSQAQAPVLFPIMLPQTQPRPLPPHDTSHLSRLVAGAGLERGGAFPPAINPHYFSEIETPVRPAWNLDLARRYTYDTLYRRLRQSVIDPGSQM